MNDSKAQSDGGRAWWQRSLLGIFSRHSVRGAGYSFVVLFFILLVLVPTLFVLSVLFTGWGDIQSTVFSEPDRMGVVWSAIGYSFGAAFLVTLLDIAFGLPIAWFLVRREFRGKALINTLIDAPLAVPTAGLGVSVALLWTGVVGSPFLLLILLHFTTTYPYMVRSLAAILAEIDIEYETAGRTFGASKLTAARTITLPLFRSGLATGAILCLAKALSETGGVMAALILLAGSSFGEGSGLNGTALIGVWKDCSKEYIAPQTPPFYCHGITDPTLKSALTFVSALLIIFSLILLAIVKLLATRFKFPLKKVWPTFEARLSKGAVPMIRDAAAFAFLIFMVLIPSFFIAGYMITGSPTSSVNWGSFWNGVILTLAIAGIATAIDLLLGIPLAILIVRGRFRRLGALLDVLVNVPYIVPSAALGISLGSFYAAVGVKGFDVFLVTMAHVAFTFPFVVRNVVGAMEGLDPGYEDTARTLGARPFQVFKRIVYPMIKPAVLAGAIMAFTRSVGETGATLSVSSDVLTAPILIVNYTKYGNRDLYTAGLLIALLTVVCFIAILAMRIVTSRRQRHA